MKLGFLMALLALFSVAVAAQASAEANPPVVPQAPPPAPPTPPTQPSSVPPPSTLKGSTVYLYSFLDVRENEFTPKVLQLIEQQLATNLAADGVQSKTLWFKKTPIGMFSAVSSSVGQSYALIPVQNVIQANGAEEAASGARFRLIAFPASFEVAGAWRNYTIRWLLFDVQTGAVVRSYDYKGKHMVVWKNSENAEARAKKIVDAVLADLRAGNLI